MKKVLVCALSAIVLTAGVSSCGKTTKGKISEDWNFTSLVGNSSSTSGGTTNSSSYSTTISGSTITSTETSGGTTDTENGTVAKYVMSIKKDGTYEISSDVTWIDGSYSQQEISTEKGTWSFVGKNKTDEFKKNERVIFNTTSENSTTTTKNNVGGSVVTNTTSGSDTYLVGQNSIIYTVVESTGKKLVLETEYNGTSSNTSASGTVTSSAYSGKTTITLEKP